MVKKTIEKNDKATLTLEQATAFLKKIGEWESVWKLDRETIIKWANFLKDRENS